MLAEGHKYYCNAISYPLLIRTGNNIEFICSNFTSIVSTMHILEPEISLNCVFPETASSNLNCSFTISFCGEELSRKQIEPVLCLEILRDILLEMYALISGHVVKILGLGGY